MPGPQDNSSFDGRPSSARLRPIPRGRGGAPQGFWEYVPPGYGGGVRSPLLVFLHGLGENGDGAGELGRVLANGIPALIRADRWPQRRPFVVLSPQHPGPGCPGAAQIHAFLEFAVATYAIDPTRVYLTGLSCGAIGSWEYLGEHTDRRIAAMVPIAGDGRRVFAARQRPFGDVAIWAFHGADDEIVPVSGTIAPIRGLQACAPRSDARMVIYPGVGHDAWTRTYDLSSGHDIYAWLLAQRLRARG